jgi:hypothetical protein
VRIGIDHGASPSPNGYGGCFRFDGAGVATFAAMGKTCANCCGSLICVSAALPKNFLFVNYSTAIFWKNILKIAEIIE